MPVAPLWSILFFFMMLTLGFSSLVSEESYKNWLSSETEPCVSFTSDLKSRSDFLVPSSPWWKQFLLSLWTNFRPWGKTQNTKLPFELWDAQCFTCLRCPWSRRWETDFFHNNFFFCDCRITTKWTQQRKIQPRKVNFPCREDFICSVLLTLMPEAFQGYSLECLKSLQSVGFTVIFLYIVCCPKWNESWLNCLVEQTLKIKIEMPVSNALQSQFCKGNPKRRPHCQGLESLSNEKHISRSCTEWKHSRTSLKFWQHACHLCTSKESRANTKGIMRFCIPDKFCLFLFPQGCLIFLMTLQWCSANTRIFTSKRLGSWLLHAFSLWVLLSTRLNSAEALSIDDLNCTWETEDSFFRSMREKSCCRPLWSSQLCSTNLWHCSTTRTYFRLGQRL